jgi:hypothetical protein
VVEVGSFTSRPHAEMAAGMLGANGIRAEVLGDDAGGVVPHVPMGSHGYRLRVADEDAEDARDLLAGGAVDDEPSGEQATDARVGAMAGLPWLRIAVALVLVVLVVGLAMGLL